MFDIVRSLVKAKAGLITGSRVANLSEHKWNPSCWYAIFVGRMNEFVRRQVAELVKTSIDAAFNHLIQYLTDCNENYGALVNNSCPTTNSREKFIQEVIRDGIYTQITPFLKGIDEAWALRMAEKYGVKTSPVSYNKVFPDGTKHRIVTKRPVLIGPRYTFKLYKEPHQRSPGLGYVSQFKSPMKPNRSAKDQYPFSQVAIRLGEDEIRNIVMTAGAETAAHIIGAYANSPAGVTNLATHLLTDNKPSQLAHIDLSLPDLIKNNVIIGVTKHIFATIGVNIAPSELEVKAIMSDKDAATAAEEVDEVSSLGEIKE